MGNFVIIVSACKNVNLDLKSTVNNFHVVVDNCVAAGDPIGVELDREGGVEREVEERCPDDLDETDPSDPHPELSFDEQ